MRKPRKAKPEIEIPYIDPDETDWMEPEPEKPEPKEPEPSNEISLNRVLEELEHRMAGFPIHSQSLFELKVFHISDQQTAERAFLKIAELLLDSLETYFNVRKQLSELDYEISDLENELNQPELQGRWSERIIKRKQSDLDVHVVTRTKVRLQVSSLLHQISYLYNEFRSFPSISLDDFEQAEYGHFTKIYGKGDEWSAKPLSNILNDTKALAQSISELRLKKASLGN